MTREEFIKILEIEGYDFREEMDCIVVISSVTSSVYYSNVWLDFLTSIPPNVKFRNNGDVLLTSLKSIPEGIEFNNGGDVSLKSVKSISPDAKFNNGGDCNLRTLIGGYFHDWPGNIEGIGRHTLLNKMISLGLLDKNS